MRSGHSIRWFCILILSSVLALASPHASTSDPAAEFRALGRYLFSSPLLSHDGRQSCSSCHDPARYFQDGQERALSRTFVQARNTPSLASLRAYSHYSWDARFRTLDEQIRSPLFSNTELGATPRSLAQALTAARVRDVWRNDQELTAHQAGELVVLALTHFVQAIQRPETVFDRHERGELMRTPEQAAGWQLFRGKAGCLSCHSGVSFTDQRVRRNGLLPRRLILENVGAAAIGPFTLGFDYGHGNILPGRENLFTFRTPTLFLVGVTAPYMHDGSFRTLREVIDFYDRGGDAPDTPLRPLLLSEYEKRALEAFLRTLDPVKQ